MATYKEIQAYIRSRDGVTVQTCWIADVMASHGLTRRIAPNRIDPSKREKPCPLARRATIDQALRHFGMLN